MKKSKSKSFIIKGTVYPFDVLVSVGENDEEFKKSLNKYCNVDSMNELSGKEDSICNFSKYRNTGARAVITASNWPILRVRRAPKTPFQIGIVAHEIFHIAHFVLDLVGIELSMETNEAYAYYIDFLTREFYENL